MTVISHTGIWKNKNLEYCQFDLKSKHVRILTNISKILDSLKSVNLETIRTFCLARIIFSFVFKFFWKTLNLGNWRRDLKKFRKLQFD